MGKGILGVLRECLYWFFDFRDLFGFFVVFLCVVVNMFVD